MSSEHKQHEGFDSHQCNIAPFGADDMFIDVVKNATVICARCGRAATSESHVCYPKKL